MAFDLSQYDMILLDLDGTIYHEDHPLPGAVEFVQHLQKTGRDFACLSNSASSPMRVMDRLQTMGMDLEPDRIYTAAAAACDYVLVNFPRDKARVEIPGSDRIWKPRVFNLATESVYEMLEGMVDWVQSGGEPCDVVLSGAPSNTFASEARQRMALQLLRKGAALVALCADRCYPSPRGLEFGSGAHAAMLGYASNVKPFFCGKPERVFFMELCARLCADPARCVLIGDNIESDIIGGKAVGMGTVLVLSGVTRRRDLLPLDPSQQPDHIIEDLRELI